LNSIARAAYNREWFAASGANAADTTVIAFSWPSLGQLFAAPPHLLPDDYLRDQSKAGQSAFHIANFFREPPTDADSGAQPGKAGVSAGPQHGQFRIGGSSRKLVQPQ
jgi:hypothetical protein